MPTAEAAPLAPVPNQLDPERLLTSFQRHAGILLAISGGPDSTALLLLAARWRAARSDGPRLFAATIDHGLRPEARQEAEAVGTLAAGLDIPHAILTWSGAKPAHGLQEAARAARYRLLATHARALGARAIATAHTLDDQAETVLFRLMRGSGISGLAGIASERALDELALLRPLLEVPKAALIAHCRDAGVAFVEDPSNRNPRFARARLRDILPPLAAEGLDAEALARLAARMARADAALEAATEAANATIHLIPPSDVLIHLDKAALFALPDEIALRLIGRAIDRVGHEGPVELGKLEALQVWLKAAADAPGGARTTARTTARTLAGALVRVEVKSVSMRPAPPRRTPISSL
ncbi:tRNA lysidine(34) synthetase TilS [Starkeya sp. ORNL1]|uniref:tRNA lysidine(34) synthetase TilS n=1 Tax=Starkeya sp. ORNL1 TaxID=2709380 RepID=UPI001FEFF435|nr:tRNA lysidine(34) synthetase TilS [Starkeya sp. ORNL1]